MADDDSEAMEAVLREVLRGVESHLGQPMCSPDAPVRDPDYNEFGPGLAEWWRTHPNAQTLILRCGIDDCHNRVGEVRALGDFAVALVYSAFDESAVEAPVRVTEESLGFLPGTELQTAMVPAIRHALESKVIDGLYRLAVL